MPSRIKKSRSATSSMANGGKIGDSSRSPDSTGPNETPSYGAIFEAIPQPVALLRLVLDEQGEPLDLELCAANKAFKETFDLSDAVGRRLDYKLHHREGHPDFLGIASRVAATGEPETHEIHLPRSKRWFKFRASVGPADSLLVCADDITDHRTAESALRRVQYSLDHIDDYPAWSDETGRIVEVSESTCRHLEYTREELLNMTVFDIYPDMDRGRWKESWSEDRPETPTRLEVMYRTKSGRKVPTELSINPMVFDGKRYHCAFCRDISDRKKAESDARRMRYSLDQMDDYPTWNDRDGRLIEVSESTCRHLEYTREELLGMTIFDISPDLDRQHWIDSWKRPQKLKGPFRNEVHHRTKSGRVFPVEITVSPMTFDNEEFHCTFCRDISERKKTESALDRLRYSLDQLDDYVIWVDSEARIMEVSESTCRHLEYSREELLTMKVTDISPGLTYLPWSEGWNRAKQMGSFHRESTQITKSGRVFPVELSVNHMVFGGQEYDCVFIRDITERKSLEDSLRLTQTSVDNSPDMIHWLDENGRFIYANRATCGFLGYTLEELCGKFIWDINPGLSRETFEQRMHASKSESIFFEETWQTRDGRKIAVEVAASNICRDAETVGVSFARDINDRKLAEHSLRESEERYRQLWEAQTKTLKALQERDEQLLQAQKMEAVGRLAGGIAHDFNNVLTTIIGYSDLLLASPECPKGPITEDITEISEAAQRASALTQRILAFSRRQTMEPTIMSLNTIVSDTERLLARTIGADIELRTSLSPDLGLVMVDEQQFVQVLLNLAVNARDAMPKGGTLTLETANIDLDEDFCATHPDAHLGPYVVLTVTDTGSGMDGEVLSHIFEPFYTTKPPGLGTGLGLATVYGVVTQSEGCIYASSERDKGTVFSLYLPRLQDIKKTSVSESAPPSERKGTPTVMVVDSDEPFLVLTSRILERRGLKVLSFRDGESAVKTLDSPGPRIDGLLADATLSGTLQGVQLIAAARKTRPDIPVLLVTERTADIETGSEYHGPAPTYLEKPFTVEELTSWVGTWLTELETGD